MFWDSVIAGLNVLSFWETYVAVIEYLAIFLIPMFVVGIIIDKGEGIGATVGCLSMFVFPLLQVAAMTIFVLTLAPIIFGIGVDAAWSFPWAVLTIAPGTFFKMVGLLVVAAVLLAFVPILGRMNSLNTLILGGIALVFVLELIASINPGIVRGRIDYIPGFWFVVGILVVGGIMSWIGMMVTVLLTAAIRVDEQGVGGIIMPFVGAVFGFIPVFIYGAWLGAQISVGY